MCLIVHFGVNDSNNTNIIQYLILHGLGLCTKLNSFVAHILYACSFSHKIEVTISNNHNKYYLSLNTYTTVFAWVAGNLKKKNIAI